MSDASPGDVRPTRVAGPAVVRPARVAGLAALHCGDQDAPPVLLLPGFTGSKEDFAALLVPLAAAGFTVTAIDLPGQFESLPSPSYTPDALAADVLRVVAELGPAPVRLLGHSFGGLVARAAAIARPDAFDSLVLLCSGPGRIGAQRRGVLELLAPVLEATGVGGVYDASLALDAADPAFVAPPAEHAEFLRRRFLAGTAEMLQGMSTALLDEPDRVDELAATGVAVAVVRGADDDAWPPSEQAEMARRLDAPYVVLDGAAHSPAVENPRATVAALLDFWGR